MGFDKMNSLDELVIFLDERRKQGFKTLVMQEWYDKSQMRTRRIECNLDDLLRSFQSWQEERHYGDRR